MGHWYKLEDGAPLYTVPMANGKGERDTTLRDARKLKLVPSVTSILGVVDKPALTKWKMDQILKAVLNHPYNPHKEPEKDWIRTIYSMSQKEGKDAAEKGNQIHNALEQVYLGNGLDPTMEEFCRPAIELLHKIFGLAVWIPEASFSHPLGFGGKCDLHMLPCGDFPNGVIVDFKTKSAQDFSKVSAYPEQCQQLVAYRQGFNIPKAKCYNLFIGTNTPGELLLHEWDEEECQSAWKCFTHLVEYWKIINKFEIN
jgi:hypothetical protein